MDSLRIARVLREDLAPHGYARAREYSNLGDHRRPQQAINKWLQKRCVSWGIVVLRGAHAITTYVAVISLGNPTAELCFSVAEQLCCYEERPCRTRAAAEYGVEEMRAALVELGRGGTHIGPQHIVLA